MGLLISSRRNALAGPETLITFNALALLAVSCFNRCQLVSTYFRLVVTPVLPRAAGGCPLVVKLNAKMVERLKPAAGKRLDYHDTIVRGLTLRITERGAKSWRVLYRHRQRLRALTLGPVSAIGLADARERAREAIHRASKGHDPASEKKSDRKAEA